MNEQNTSSKVSLCVDLKKYRIRVSKEMLHKLDDPQYIQLLVNPAMRLVAIKSVNRKAAGNEAHRISERVMNSEHSIEIYSRHFIRKLIEVAGELDCGLSYSLTGRVIPTEELAVFPLSTLTRIIN